MYKIPYEILYEIFLYVDKNTLITLSNIEELKDVLNNVSFWMDKFALDYPDLKNAKCLNVNHERSKKISTYIEYIPIKVYYEGKLIGYILKRNPINHGKLYSCLIKNLGELLDEASHQFILLDGNYEVLQYDEYQDATTLLLGLTPNNYIFIFESLVRNNLPLPQTLKVHLNDSVTIIDWNCYTSLGMLEYELTGNDVVKIDKYHNQLIDLAFKKLKLQIYLNINSSNHALTNHHQLTSCLNLWYERKHSHHYLKDQIDKFILTYVK